MIFLTKLFTNRESGRILFAEAARIGQELFGTAIMKQDYVFYLKLLAKTVEQKAKAEFGAQGLTLTQAKTLAFLDDRPGKSATQKEMEKFFAVSHPTITGVVRRLERQGLVLSEEPKRGRASKQVMLTEKGIETCRRNTLVARKYREAMIRGITSEEMGVFEDILRRMCENVCGESRT